MGLKGWDFVCNKGFEGLDICVSGLNTNAMLLSITKQLQ